jgi:hypothetical protein
MEKNPVTQEKGGIVLSGFAFGWVEQWASG